jgi:hypothetical protein
MTDKRTEQFLTAALIMNSLLLGLMLFFLFAVLGSISTILDQESRYRSFPSITEWAVNFRPKDLTSTLSVIAAVVSTSLFVGLAFRGCKQNSSIALLYFAVHSCLWLLAGAYFFFFVTAVTFSRIHVGGGLYAAANALPPSPSIVTAPCISSHIWLVAAVVYSLGLVICGIILTRRHKEVSSPAS